MVQEPGYCCHLSEERYWNVDFKHRKPGSCWSGDCLHTHKIRRYQGWWCWVHSRNKSYVCNLCIKSRNYKLLLLCTTVVPTVLPGNSSSRDMTPDTSPAHLHQGCNFTSYINQIILYQMNLNYWCCFCGDLQWILLSISKCKHCCYLQNTQCPKSLDFRLRQFRYLDRQG